MALQFFPGEFEKLVGPTLLNGKGEEVLTAEVLQNKQHIMLYFSAHWCPPCRKFTPQLEEAYTAHKAYVLANSLAESNTIGEIEVIFISLDSVRSEYDNYRKSMPWLSVPFENLHKLQIKDTLSQKFSVQGIPALIVLDGSSGKIVTKNGRGEYGKYFKGEYTTGSTSGCILS